MNILDAITDTSDKFSDAGERYLEKSQEYYKLKVFQQLTISISLVVKALAIGGFLLVALFFLAFAAALAIGQWLDNAALGYIIVAAIFFIFTIIIYIKRGFINKKIISTLSTKFFES
ncbi:hypothetical protein [Lacinutrix undariae]